ncbi:hypothetical protein A7K69_02235 [Parageobacillus thermoglucosidasius]|jgi:hypothetical protein|uniref:Uncharacterized protein n=1 Tax=Parageobacillus thermoglucosidasius TaxID=1426 RepID=A0A1B7KWT6_PARTM|nr:hypothetical protein A7K69_02235 [Parageobacillus thermoglucosidasius]
MIDKSKHHVSQQSQCSEGCCQGDEILCISIPCPITIVLLGLELQLELPCVRLTSPDNLTPAQAQQILASLTNLLGNLVTSTTS